MTSYIVKRFGIEVDLSKDGHTGCPRCISQGRDRSRDNFKTYGLDEEGMHKGGFCWSCSMTIPSQALVEENEEEEIELVGSEFNEDIHEKLKQATNTDRKGYRGIRRDITTFFGVRASFDQETGKVHRVYYPTTKDYELIGYKVRQHPKKFITPLGEVGKECDLFGQFRFKTSNHTVIIVGGEEDVLAAYQMLSDDIKRKGNRYSPPAVVSATVGESGAYRQCKEQYEWLNQHRKVIIAMDDDKAGQEATEKLAEVLPRGKVFVMKMRYKDPNEYVTQGKEKEFIEDFWGAKPWTPSGVHASSSLYEAALEYTNVERLSLPPFLKKASDMFGGGWVKNELSVIFAQTSQGKSLFVDSCVNHWVMNEPNEVVGVMSLEASKDKYATNIISRYLGVNLNGMEGGERREYLEREDVKKKVKSFLTKDDGGDRFYVYDSRGADLEETKESILEMIIKLGVTILVADPFSDLMAGTTLEEQESFIAWLKKLILEYPQLSVVLVAHTRKMQNGEVGLLTESDIMGSSATMKAAAQTLSIERDKLHEDPIMRNVSTVTVHKNRHAASTGVACEVYYDYKTGLLHDWEEYQMENPDILME